MLAIRPRALAGDSPLQRLSADVLAVGPLILSQPEACDLVIYRGDSGSFRVSVTDADGAALDVSTATWDCDIRQTADDPVVMASLTVTPVAGSTDKVDVSVTAAISSTLQPGPAWAWDLEMTLGGAVTTLLAGGVQVIADVSRAP